MGIKIDQLLARGRLLEAVDWAKDLEKPVPQQWIEITDRVAAAGSKTLVAFLGTALLARATDGRVDALAVKERYSETSYSARTLCHNVLVPVSKSPGREFHLGAMGREPLNNQPFFRYDHLDTFDKTRSPADFDYLRQCVRDLNSYGPGEALAALAAFVRSRMKAYAERDDELRYLSSDQVDVAVLVDILDQFLREGAASRPLRLQAIVGGLVRATGQRVSAQSLNDPSRNAPGDIHVPDADDPHWVAEVRGKPVPHHEAVNFVERCAASASVRTCWLVVLAPRHDRLDRDAVAAAGDALGILATVIEDLPELVTAIAGHPAVPPTTWDEVPSVVLDQLGKIRADQATLNEWRTLWQV